MARFESEYLALATDLVSDLGGLLNMTAAQRALAAATLEVHLVRRRLGRNLAGRGLVRRDGTPRAALAAYFTAANTERLNWLALGLDRRARRVDSYVAEVLERQRGVAGPQGRDPGTPKGEAQAPGPALSGPGVPASDEAAAPAVQPWRGRGSGPGDGPDPSPAAGHSRTPVPGGRSGGETGSPAGDREERGHGRRAASRTCKVAR